MLWIKSIYNLFLFILISLNSFSLNAENVPSLKIAGWDVYADPERSDKTIGYESFERKTGVEIIFKPLSNMDDIVNLAESDESFDLFIISNEGIKILHDMGLLAPVDLQKIPHYQNLHHNLKYTEWSQFDSRVYAVPWAWGPTGLMYDSEIIKNPETWKVLWDPKYKGKVAMWDDVSMIWTTALSLGYKNVYSLTRDQLEKVKQKLFEFNDLNAHYYKGGGELLELVKQGKIVAYNSWYDPSNRLKSVGKKFAMIIPHEGAVGMFDSFLISNKTNDKKLAHQYINHQIEPYIQNKMVKITGLAPSNIETLTLLSPDEIRAHHLDDPDYFNRMLLWDNMPRKNLYDDVLKSVRDDSRNKQR